VPQGDWKFQNDTKTKEVNKELPNDLSVLGNFFVHASPSTVVKIFQFSDVSGQEIK
jgi:hypothetical protein